MVVNDCTCVKEMMLKVCVHRCRKRKNHKERVVRRRETKGRREKIEIEKKEKKRPAGVCSCGGQLRGLSSPSAPPWPQPEAFGGPWVPEEKHLGPPSPLNPALGCLPWPGCLTALLMLHTGTQGP